MYPVTWRIYYLGATYYRYQFPGKKPHIVIKQGFYRDHPG
jgi:hypothetical protein